MKELKFKTSLSCVNCLEKVTPGLNAISEIDKWEVDLGDENKILTVQTVEDVEDKIKNAFESKGFEAIRL
ncbi:MAG: hypothetical protein WC994_07225 [Brumimicrobium sp.]